MKKKILLRAMLGFPLAIFMSYTISLIISLVMGDGKFYTVAPEMIAPAGSELNATLLQYLLSGLLGAGFAAGSLIWEVESWSITKRTVLHLILSAVVMFPIAYWSYWMPHTPLGVLLYILIFVGIYAGIWAGQYFTWMRKIQDINRKLRNP